MAIPIVDVSANVLRKDGWRLLAILDCMRQRRVHRFVLLSTATEGLVLFADKEGSLKVSATNEAGDCVPFATPRIKGYGRSS